MTCPGRLTIFLLKPKLKRLGSFEARVGNGKKSQILGCNATSHTEHPGLLTEVRKVCKKNEEWKKSMMVQKTLEIGHTLDSIHSHHQLAKLNIARNCVP